MKTIFVFFSTIRSEVWREMESEEKCFLCPSVSTTQCELCDSKISHCEAHQRFHRPVDGGPCFPYLVSEVAGVGRMMVAARGVAAGEASQLLH